MAVGVCVGVPVAELHNITVDKQHVGNEERHSVRPAGVRIQLGGIPADTHTHVNIMSIK